MNEIKLRANLPISRDITTRFLAFLLKKNVELHVRGLQDGGLFALTRIRAYYRSLCFLLSQVSHLLVKRPVIFDKTTRHL